MLEFVNLEEEFLSIFVLYGLWMFVGEQMAGNKTEVRHRARICGGGAFLVFAITGLIEAQPSTATELAVITLKAILFAGLVQGAAMIVLPTGAFFYDLLLKPKKVFKPPPPPVKEPERKREEVIEREPPPPPPDPKEQAIAEYNEAVRAAKAIEDEEMRDELLGMAEIKLRRETGGLT